MGRGTELCAQYIRRTQEHFAWRCISEGRRNKTAQLSLLLVVVQAYILGPRDVIECVPHRHQSLVVGIAQHEGVGGDDGGAPAEGGGGVPDVNKWQQLS